MAELKNVQRSLYSKVFGDHLKRSTNARKENAELPYIFSWRPRKPEQFFLHFVNPFQVPLSISACSWNIFCLKLPVLSPSSLKPFLTFCDLNKVILELSIGPGLPWLCLSPDSEFLSLQYKYLSGPQHPNYCNFEDVSALTPHWLILPLYSVQCVFFS